MVRITKILGFSGALVLAITVQPGWALELTEADFLGGGEATVLSASRLAQPIMDAPNAVTVLDRATIEASGYHTLTDLFRLVPGMYVGQITGWSHSVTHTIADEFARRMQVLVDGRSVYLPSIGGVRWDTLPLAIDDIERIEVVRGPNAATFGANAMTGVINIITRHPEDVQGRMLHLVSGDKDHGEAWFRWAGSAENSSHRVTFGRREDGGFDGQNDDEHSNALNYRGNFLLHGQQMLDVQFGLLGGDRGAGRLNSVNNPPHPQDVASGYFQVDYLMPLQAANTLTGKFYYNELDTEEVVPAAILPGSYYVIDLVTKRWHAEAQYNAVLSDALRTSLGAFLRRDSFQSAHYFSTSDPQEVDSKGVFAHAEWRMSPEWLLNLGGFWEDYDLVGPKLSPRLAINWQPSPQHTVRFGVAKAYRNPVIFETNANWAVAVFAANGALLGTVGPYIVASGGVRPESVFSQEISYLGTWPEQGVSLDVRVFDERIRNLISTECPPGDNCSGNPPPDPRDFFNIGGTRQRGAEVQLKWQPSTDTQVLANYTLLHIDSNISIQNYSPSNLLGVHVMHRLPKGFDVTVSHYWTASFEPIGESLLPSSRRWDLRLAKSFKLAEAKAQVALGVLNAGGDYREFTNSPASTFDTRGYVHLKLDF